MKKYLLLMMLLVSICAANAQISIQPALPLAGIVQKSNLWNVAVINSSAGSFDCRIELTLRNRASGLEVLTATTGRFQIGTGAKQLNSSLLMPIQYNYISVNGNGRTDDLIPIGDYTACYRLTTGEGKLLGEECVSFDVEALSPPMLISPADSAVLDVQPSQFTWIPPAPMNLFNRLQYEVLITEIFPGQKAEEAMQQNLPFYTEPNVPVNNLTYRGMASSFEKDKWYAWQVVARDNDNYAGKSEVWVFKVEESPIADLLTRQAPYLKMKKEAPEKGFAPNGTLKVSFINETSDSVVNMKIIDLNDHNKLIMEFPVRLKPGENLMQFNLKKKLNAPDRNLYEASVANSRKELWRLQFEVQKFDDKK